MHCQMLSGFFWERVAKWIVLDSRLENQGLIPSAAMRTSVGQTSYSTLHRT